MNKGELFLVAVPVWVVGSFFIFFHVRRFRGRNKTKFLGLRPWLWLFFSLTLFPLALPLYLFGIIFYWFVERRDVPNKYTNANLRLLSRLGYVVAIIAAIRWIWRALSGEAPQLP